jgi:hypothetical protein
LLACGDAGKPVVRVPNHDAFWTDISGPTAEIWIEFDGMLLVEQSLG